MKSVTIQINDLFEFEGQPVPAQRPENSVVETMARRQFEFLRQPVQVEIGQSTVIVSFSEESSNSQDEAGRLAERAAKRAAEGNYEKAISLWKRVLELNPSLHKGVCAIADCDTAHIPAETFDAINSVEPHRWNSQAHMVFPIAFQHLMDQHGSGSRERTG